MKFPFPTCLSVLGALAAFATVQGAEPTQTPLLLDAKTNNSWEIVVPDGAPDSVQLAGRELQEYVEKSVGLKMPITAQRSADKARAFYLGDSEFAREKGVNPETFAPDGFRLLSGDSWIIIAGKDYAGPPLIGEDNPYRINESYNSNLKISVFGDTGTQQGVYEFLRSQAGIRWYMPGELGEIVPERERLEIPPLDLSKHPAYQQRYAYFCFFSSSDEDALWFKRVGYGTPFPVEVSHSFGRLFLKYKDDHPEYFALIDGQRDFTNLSSVMGPGNLNMANPDVVERAITDISAYFDQHPNVKIFGLCPPDGMRRISEDPASQAMIDHSRGEDGKYSDYVWAFINKVAAGVRKNHPDKLIGCIAYESYRLPPKNIEKLEPNVAVVICKFRRNHWDDTFLDQERKLIAEWHRKASVLYGWEYYCDILLNPGWRGYPTFYPQVVKNDLTAWNGILRGEFIEAESWTYDQYSNPKDIQINYPGLQHPLLYVTAQMMWDPSQDLDAMLAEYYTLFYGDAAEAMKKFWTTTENAWMNRPKGDSPSSVFDRATVQALLQALAEAKKQVPEGSPYAQRIAMIETEFSPAAGRTERLAEMVTPSIKIPALPEGGKADGILENDFWKDAALFQLIDSSYQKAVPATHIRAGWTPEALKLAITCFEPKMANLKAAITETSAKTDNVFWTDDVVEIFLQPQGTEGKPTFHFGINSKGVLYDAVNRTTDWAGDDESWNSGATVAVRKDEGNWLIELSIPWASLGGQPPAAGQVLRANFYRSRMASGLLQQYSWAPLVNGYFFSPKDFGTLTLSNQPED